jgi:putative sigma-54 modulation protein
MNITVKGTDLEVTEAIRAYVESRLASLDKLVEEFGESVTAAADVGKSEKHHAKGAHFRAEFMLEIPNKVLRSESEAEDLYEAIDQAKDDLRRQLVDHKNILKESHRGPRPDKA